MYLKAEYFKTKNSECYQCSKKKKLKTVPSRLFFIFDSFYKIFSKQVHVTAPHPKTDFKNEKYIIILYLFCTILYTECQIL